MEGFFMKRTRFSDQQMIFCGQNAWVPGIFLGMLIAKEVEVSI
jgi:hypothetical protein